MTEYSTILIPSNLQEPITISDIPPSFGPIHVALASRENPDEFEMEFFQGLDTNEENDRATMIAESVAQQEGKDGKVFTGYILMRCDKLLADRLVENDAAFIAESQIVRSFREWMNDYAYSHDVDVHKVFSAVACYAGRILADADARAEADMQQTIADMMGLRPEQVGVIRL